MKVCLRCEAPVHVGEFTPEMMDISDNSANEDDPTFDCFEKPNQFTCPDYSVVALNWSLVKAKYVKT